MNISKNKQSLTFEIYESDLKVLYNHAYLASEAGSIDSVNPSIDSDLFELESKYIIAQLPNLYDYLVIHRRYDSVFGNRNSENDPRTFVFNITLTNEIAHKYYWIQHRYGRLGAMNALINLFEHRQKVIEERARNEMSGNANHFRYPFKDIDWPFSTCTCEKKGIYKGYHIDVNKSISDSICEYLKLREVLD
ncbi:MAG: hypothetical protein MK198_06750 [Gracilimonas sp.]|uniref:hypothetical protein n=1 Tax=Gracilimonas sp. TaxID=1974203 RepID=UPI003752568E|nr:hypothetical protein [Gracilimonas sp.]